jgi:hypothetical protein
MFYAIQFKKVYLFGNEDKGGMYRWYVNKTTMEKETLFKHELGCPIYKNMKDLLLAVEHFEPSMFNHYNPLLGSLLKQEVYGMCSYLVIDTEKKRDILYNIIKKELTDLGATEKTFDMENDEEYINRD